MAQAQGQRPDPPRGRHRLQIDWHGENKEVFAKEERELTVYHVPGGTMIDFAARLRTTGGLVKLATSREPSKHDTAHWRWLPIRGRSSST